MLLVLLQLGARLGGHVALKEQLQEKVCQFRPLLAVRLCQGGGVGAAAEARVLRRGQRQRQVLARQQRLAVEPRRPAVPPLHRRRGEYALAPFPPPPADRPRPPPSLPVATAAP